jgi:hypothetical protein
VDTIRNNPVPTALVGLGVVWLLMNGGKARASTLQDVEDAAAFRIERALEENPLAVAAVLGAGKGQVVGVGSARRPSFRPCGRIAPSTMSERHRLPRSERLLT